MAEAVTTKGGALYVVQTGDVPSVLRMDGKKWPLGRYLKARLRDECGYDQPVSRNSGAITYTAGYVLTLQRLQEELQSLEGREARESRRLQHGRTAEARVKISESKRTI